VKALVVLEALMVAAEAVLAVQMVALKLEI
jgi:hypothetical protein